MCAVVGVEQRRGDGYSLDCPSTVPRDSEDRARTRTRARRGTGQHGVLPSSTVPHSIAPSTECGGVVQWYPRRLALSTTLGLRVQAWSITDGLASTDLLASLSASLSPTPDKPGCTCSTYHACPVDVDCSVVCPNPRTPESAGQRQGKAPGSSLGDESRSGLIGRQAGEGASSNTNKHQDCAHNDVSDKHIQEHPPPHSL